MFCSGRMKPSRKIAMEKRETREQRAVTFTKRRKGLFNKAAELCMLSGSQIGLVACSPCYKQNLHAFGYPSVEAVFDAFFQGRVPEAGDGETIRSAICLYNKVKDMEGELAKRTAVKKISSDELWKNFEFEQVLERFDSLPELNVAVEEMEKLRERAVQRLNDLLADKTNINSLQQHDDGELGAVTRSCFNQDACVIDNNRVEEKYEVVSCLSRNHSIPSDMVPSPPASSDDSYSYWLNNYQDVMGLESSSSTPTPKQHAFGSGSVTMVPEEYYNITQAHATTTTTTTTTASCVHHYYH